MPKLIWGQEQPGPTSRAGCSPPLRPCRESKGLERHPSDGRAQAGSLLSARENETALTNVFTGRPARGIMNRAMREIGPISDAAPDFPLAATALASLRTKAEAAGRDHFTALWAGQAFRLAKEMSARDLTTMLARDAQKRLERGSAQE